MTERIIVTLVAFAAMTVLLVTVDWLLRFFFDEDMKPKRRKRREPWGDTR